MEFLLVIVLLISTVPLFVAGSRGQWPYGIFMALLAGFSGVMACLFLGLLGPVVHAVGVGFMCMSISSRPEPYHPSRGVLRGSKRKRARKTCHDCGESVARKARVCRFCGLDLGDSGEGPERVDSDRLRALAPLPKSTARKR